MRLRQVYFPNEYPPKFTMCSIAGVINFHNMLDASSIDRMNAAMRHRGPDAQGRYQTECALLGQCRLSIIDISAAANQPFADASGRYVMVFNGEIYNYKEVRNQLDYPWKTNSDTEVILAAFILWGASCLERLNGMFAFAIWDRETRELFVARDRLGVKPFYFHSTTEHFVFASEVRGVLASGLVDARLDRQSLQQYLGGVSVKTPHSILEGIEQLLPGEYAVLNEQGFTRSIYWRLAGGPASATSGVGGAAYADYGRLTARLRELLDASVQMRMVADVPVGAFLSGGIDSSAIVALMARHHDQPVQTFSIVFEDKAYDESEYARLVASKYQTDHTELLLDPQDVVRILPEYIQKTDHPTLDGINTFIVSKLVAQTGIKVALSGVGGDELFAGYPGFQRWLTVNKHRKLLESPAFRWGVGVANSVVKTRALAKLHDLARMKRIDLSSFYAASRSVFVREDLAKLLNIALDERDPRGWDEVNFSDAPEFPLLSQYSIAELSGYTLDVLLHDTDQMSMAWGLEIREPFFDYQLIEYVLRMPDAFKADFKTPKKVLVDAMGDLLPPEIVHRPKKGFSFPWDAWLRNELKDFCANMLRDLDQHDVFNAREVSLLWERFLLHDRRVSWIHIWSLVMLQAWLAARGIGNRSDRR